MRTKLSKLIAIAFILLTTLGGAISGYAAPGSRPANGDLTIHKHWAETSGDIGNEGSGEKLPDGAITNPAVKGIQFDVYSMTPVAPATEIPPSEKDGWTYSRTDNVLTVSKSGETSMTYNLVKKVADAKYTDGKTDANGELKYSGLAAGYYFVEENLTASTGYEVQGTGNAGKTITSTAKPFITAVPMTNPAGDGWNSDVHVYPKNQGLSPEKEPEVPSVNVGDKVKWTITANVPSDIAGYKKFDVIDELDKRLNYVTNSVKIVGLDSGDTEVITLTPIDFEVVHTPATDSAKESIKIELKDTGIAKLGTSGVVKVAISFETIVNGNIKSDDENAIENDASIEFDNGTIVDVDETPVTTVHTGEIKINKTYSGGTVTESAQFQLAKTSVDAEAGNYYRVVLDSSNSYITDIVAPGETGYDTAKKWVALPSQAATGETVGLVGDIFYVTSFEGLRTYTGPDDNKVFDSYYLVETKAPEDYNLLDEPVEVTFTETDLGTKYIHTEAIENKKGFTLPNTGGVGTILLVVFGIVLIGLAIILTMNKKKKTA
ncbi:SpaH/EbpB family LPXTG-anchored major pilin [Candidatus Enterococcus murrayae]|uniref:SpaH/EbpB family LPXTG-anchored major pilin n=1 Tax=Candidatus Enterococcus murrayae TaxID=2815321 RepID=A0ABS3HGH1_9ENTE|nr:SpaH/EbpB family LPXTG-anchored major pilin [Enterococcus sp. MJM16]MBO0452010.1 SpaH/EbpB family LPXTG-anchored major pilin [Enterococcus sp. MJM16]